MLPKPGLKHLRPRCRARHRSTFMRDTVCDLDVLKAKRSTVDKATLHSSSLRGASEGMRHVAANVAFDADPNPEAARSNSRRPTVRERWC